MFRIYICSSHPDMQYVNCSQCGPALPTPTLAGGTLGSIAGNSSGNALAAKDVEDDWDGQDDDGLMWGRIVSTKERFGFLTRPRDDTTSTRLRSTVEQAIERKPSA